MKMMPSGYPVSTDREYFQYCDVSISVFLETGQQGPPGGSGFPMPGPPGPRGDTGITGPRGATGFQGKLIEKKICCCLLSCLFPLPPFDTRQIRIVWG